MVLNLQIFIFYSRQEKGIAIPAVLAFPLNLLRRVRYLLIPTKKIASQLEFIFNFFFFKGGGTFRSLGSAGKFSNDLSLQSFSVNEQRFVNFSFD